MATYAEIQAQIEALTQQAEDLLRAEKDEAIAQIRELMAQYGIAIEDLRSRRRGVQGTGVAKYKDPQSGKTWSGRGRSPRWMSDAEAKGTSRDQFLV